MPLRHLCEPVELAPGMNVWAERVNHGPQTPGLDRFPHYHSVAELVIFESGNGSFWLDGKETPLHPRSLVYVPPMCHHDYVFGPGKKSWVLVQLDADTVQALSHALPELDLAQPFYGVPTESQAKQLDILCDLLLEVSQSNPQSAIVTRAAELIVWAAHATRVAPSAAQRQGQHVALPVDRLRPALEALRAQPGKEWTLEQMASLCHMSANYFSRRFGEIMGMSLTAYVRVHRLQLAARRLVQGREPIGIIAQDAGFPSPAHFAFQFKQRFGLTPRAYRQAGQTRSLPQPVRTSA
jgi:AraC-like DNA-binding protein